MLNALYCITVACHTKGIKNTLKQKVRLWNFVNVSNPLNITKWNRNLISSTAQQIYFFTILPCFEDNIKLLSSSLTERYANKNSYFTNSPTKCQSVSQITAKYNYFTYNFKKINVGHFLGGNMNKSHTH